MEFREFPKMGRWSRDIIITEKIDGTNAQIYVHNGPFEYGLDTQVDDTVFIRAGSRARWISTQDDNFGFAKWVYANAHTLKALGIGIHFGEWWGQGIQRGYGLQEKRFSLFNTERWANNPLKPDCCYVTPVLYKGLIGGTDINMEMGDLQVSGSIAAPGFMRPEGIVIFHIHGNVGFKKTFEKDETGKWDKS